MKKAYEIIVEQILDKLDGKTLPWQMTWKGGTICNYETNKSYRGINKLVLAFDSYNDKCYLTINQVKKLKGKIKKGSKSQKVIYWQFTDKENEKLEYPIIRYYNVFNVENVEGLKLDKPKVVKESNKYKAVNKLIDNYISNDGPRIKSGPNPVYKIGTDTIFMPSKDKFSNLNNYYSVLCHELIHSTGSKYRLNRFNDNVKFGSSIYSKEELVAELGSMFLAMEVGINNIATSNNIAYIQSWTKFMKDNVKEVITASQQAQKACDYIFGNINNELLGSNKNIKTISDKNKI